MADTKEQSEVQADGHGEPLRQLPDSFGRGDEKPSAKSNGRNSETDDEKDEQSDDEDDNKSGDDKSDPDKKPGEDDFKKDDEDKKKPWTRQQKLLAATIVGGMLIVGIIVGTLWWLHARQYESTDDAFVDGHWEKVAPQVAGRVLKVLVDDNDRVKDGQSIIEIDKSDFQVAVEQAEAAVAEAKGKVQQAEAQKAVAEADVEQSKANEDKAKSDRDNAITEQQRYEGLSPEAASKQKLDDLRTATRTAEAQLTAASKALAAAQAQVGYASSMIESNQAALKSAQSQLDLANLRLSWTDVRAITSGRVTNRSVQPGDYVAVGQQLLLIVPHDLYVTANYKETQLNLMRPGQPVEIDIDAFPNHPFYGKVQSLQRGSGAWFSLLPPENATGNYVKVVQRVPVKITFDDTSSDDYQRIGPGMSVVPTVKVR